MMIAYVLCCNSRFARSPLLPSTTIYYLICDDLDLILIFLSILILSCVVVLIIKRSTFFLLFLTRAQRGEKKRGEATE